MNQREIREVRNRMTLRQKQIFDAIRAGESIKETAERLGVSIQDVKHLRGAVYRLLGIAPYAGGLMQVVRKYGWSS